MCPACSGGQADVLPILPDALATEDSQGADEIGGVYGARGFTPPMPRRGQSATG